MNRTLIIFLLVTLLVILVIIKHPSNRKDGYTTEYLAKLTQAKIKASKKVDKTNEKLRKELGLDSSQQLTTTRISSTIRQSDKIPQLPIWCTITGYDLKNEQGKDWDTASALLTERFVTKSAVCIGAVLKKDWDVWKDRYVKANVYFDDPRTGVVTTYVVDVLIVDYCANSDCKKKDKECCTKNADWGADCVKEMYPAYAKPTPFLLDIEYRSFRNVVGIQNDPPNLLDAMCTGEIVQDYGKVRRLGKSKIEDRWGVKFYR